MSLPVRSSWSRKLLGPFLGSVRGCLGAVGTGGDRSLGLDEVGELALAILQSQVVGVMLGALTHVAGPAEALPGEAGHAPPCISGSVHGVETTWLRFSDTR